MTLASRQSIMALVIVHILSLKE